MVEAAVREDEMNSAIACGVLDIVTAHQPHVSAVLVGQHPVAVASMGTMGTGRNAEPVASALLHLFAMA